MHSSLLPNCRNKFFAFKMKRECSSLIVCVTTGSVPLENGRHEKSASDWAHFPSDVPAKILSSTSMLTSSSEMSTETCTFSNDENETPCEQEGRVEQLVESKESQVQLTPDSSPGEEVGMNKVVNEIRTESNGDEGPFSDGQEGGPSHSNISGSKVERSTNSHPQEMPASSRARDNDHRDRSSFNRGPRWEKPRWIPVNLFVIAPKSVEAVVLQLKWGHELRAKKVDDFFEKGIDSKFNCWCSRDEVEEHRLQSGEMSAKVSTYIQHDESFSSLLGANPFSRFRQHLENMLDDERTPEEPYLTKVTLPNHLIHVHVISEEGAVKNSPEYNLNEWLAVLWTLILATDGLTFPDTFAEYYEKRRNDLVTMLMSEKQSSSGSMQAITQWVKQMQKRCDKNLSPKRVARVGLFCVALLDILAALRNLPSELAIKAEDLAEAYFGTLGYLHRLYEGVTSKSPILEQGGVRHALQAAMAQIVNCVSPFTYDWIGYLEMFLFYDPTLEFLNELRPCWLGDLKHRAITESVGREYEKLIRTLLDNPHLFRSSPEKLVASGCALQAAPTIPSFFQAAHLLEKAGWLLVNDSIEAVAAEHIRLIDEALGKCTSHVTEKHEKPGGRKARLQLQLELALTVELSNVYSFVANSFRDHLIEVFQEIISLEDEPQRGMRDSLSFLKSQSTPISDLFFSLVTSPHAFTSPLRPREVGLLSSLSMTSNPKVHASGRIALVALANLEISYTEYHEVLQVWIQADARKRVSKVTYVQGYLPPHTFVASLEELLKAGVKDSMAPHLSKMAMSMAVNECPSLPAFLQDSKDITANQEKVVKEHYLAAASRMMEAALDTSLTRSQLDEAACASLRAICQMTNRGNLQFQNSIGEHLCVKLLDTITKAYSALREELDLRPTETLMVFKFATLLMQIEKCPQSIKSHMLYKMIYGACEILGDSLHSKSVSLRYLNSSSFNEDWEKIYQIMGNERFLTAVKKAHGDLLVYKKRLEGFTVLVHNICPFLTANSIPVEEYTPWKDWLVRRSSEWENFTLGEIHSSPDHWPREVHKAMYDYLDPLVTLHGSRIFLNILLEWVPGHGKRTSPVVESDNEAIPRITLSTVASDIFPQAVYHYEGEMGLYVAPIINFDRIRMERVKSLLNGVDPNAVETEFDIARAQLGWSSTTTHEFLKRFPEKETNIMEYLRSWKGVDVLRELHTNLQLVASVFDLNKDCDGLVPRIWIVITQCTPLCSLRRFQEVLQDDGRNLLNLFSTSEVDTLRELTRTGKLIIFLRETVNEDLRHLLDAVEDPNATRSWEGLINDLIDLQRIFRPVLSADTVCFEDLHYYIIRELNTSSSSSNHLCKKLEACNKEADGLRQYFLQVANRMYKDNNQITSILRYGVYSFKLSEEGCFLALSCDNGHSSLPESSTSSQAEKVYTLPELLELRSRAKWNLSSNTFAKKSKTAQQFGPDWAGTDAEAIDSTDECAIMFISHIDVAEQIVSLLTELHNCGHFWYATFERAAPNFAALQILTEFLKAELTTWNAALARARRDFLCLNFFRSVELRLILDVLLMKYTDGAESTEKLEQFSDLFKWAGIPSMDSVAAQLLASRDLLSDVVSQITEAKGDGVEDSIYVCLARLASVMESSIFQTKIVEECDAGSSTTKQSQRRLGIILADVDDPQRELDAVVTLFSERHLILHGNASNVIVCGPLTAWEDLYLLLLRYLNNLGRDNYFYCLACVERLSFDCQAHLVTFIQNMVKEFPIRENELALVSCSRSKFLHTLSQRLQIQVRHIATGTGDGDGIGTKEDCLYSKMWVITSDLSGMGKTRYVQKFAETNHFDCRKTLTISGEVARNLLIQRLKKLQMQSCSSTFLHLDISVVSNPETLSDLLFELLMLGCLKSDRAGLFHLNTPNVAIEVANTFHNYLASKLPVTRWFRAEHLEWNMENFEPSTSESSDDQIVCNYLLQLQRGQLYVWNPDGISPNRRIDTIRANQCHWLLQLYFVDHMRDQRSISYSLLQTFTKLLAQQLREFTKCPFFVPENLTHMRAQSNTRSTVVRAILEVCRDLCIRSVKPWLDEQQESTVRDNAEDMMAERMDNMLRWSDSKRVMIFFQLIGRMAVLYKDPSHVPIALVDLFRKQNAKLPNYEKLSSEELFKQLWPLLQKTPPPVNDSLYVLTADNFLKMALIFTKVKANVPVVIMGETGCGKTSLLRQLAHYCSVPLFSVTLHAGTTEDNIRKFMLEAESQASKHVVWVFLDEINACEHLGFLVGVVCHHTLDGKPLHDNIKILAACNPYRKHDSTKQRGAGLSARKLLNNVEHLEKAYTVHPLPEALVDHVQDFGILNVKDERLYIEAMVRRSTGNQDSSFPFVELIVMSQAFVKEKCGEASVSLRDARRCIDLFLFFRRDLDTRPQATPPMPADRKEKRAALLSFAHCYYYRLASGDERIMYRKKYVATINGNKRRLIFRRGTFDEKEFERELYEEQMSLLSHMEIPPGIAKNQALRENVFVTLTCILQKIPLFVVGKPGSGKTLSLQLIFSNLRGSGMKDPYFRQKPTMFMFSYQGSESSTSEGILKVFDKAYRCVEDNKKKNVNAVVVVVLDEVGLAEISSHNPLKVLHALLEPDGEQQVAVVGISNWSLDAAKMNRAIHISQPDPEILDLVATGEAILDSYGMRKIYGAEQMREMKWLAEAYHAYHKRQSKPDFHGLRDFYSLIKSLRGDEKVPKPWTSNDLVRAVWRNFGGSPNDIDLLISILSPYFPMLPREPPPALDLVKSNLDDIDARHLMLISTGESSIGILDNTLPREEKLIIVHGSKYKDDCSDDYAYSMLSNIILHMEHGRHILLKGVERVWSSLYDMLNQHYTIVGGRRNCRIAIGAYSNPMCYVHDNFRCIVVVNQSQVQSLDPPFLNRFEKQVLTWEAVLTPQQKEIVELLKTWVKAMAGADEDESDAESTTFSDSDLFANYSADSLASLVLKNWGTESAFDIEVFLARCKEELLLTAYPDGMMRAHYSKRCQRDAPDCKKWTEAFFQKRSDQEFLLSKIRQHIGDKKLWQDDLGCKIVLTTRSNVHTNIKLLLENLHDVNIQVIKLGDFTADRQLSAAIQHWSRSNSNLLIIQSDAVLDRDHLPLAKVHVERTRADLFAEAQDRARPKHVFFIVHSHRGEQETSFPFSFLSGWKQITVDQLHQENTDYREYLDKSIVELFQTERFREGQNLMIKVLTWSFLCIKYPRGRQVALHCQQMVQSICQDKELYDCFMRRAVMWLEEDAKKEAETGKIWQTSVVCNRGRLALASNLHYAFSQYVEEKLREPIARLIYVLESKSALGSYFNMSDARKELWRNIFMDRQTINIDLVPQPMHPEGYTIQDPMDLSLPFSSLYAEHVDKHMQELYLSRATDLNAAHPLAYEKDISQSIRSNLSMQQVEECVKANHEDYCHDFAMLYAPYQPNAQRTAPEASIFEWLVRENVRQLKKPLMLHALVWRKAETLKAQALLASSCFTEEEITTELERSRSVFMEDFDVNFTSQCVKKMLPSEARVIEKVGGLKKWMNQFDVLIKLVSNIGDSTTHTSITLMLRVLHDFARLVVYPLSMALGELCSLSHWFQRRASPASPELLITKISSLLPDMNVLQGFHRDMYFRFIASTFSRLLESAPLLPQDVLSTMSAVIFRLKAPTCLMKGVMVRLLKAAVQVLIPAPSPDCPTFVQLSLLTGQNVIREQAWDSESYEPFILLCDVIYDSVRDLISPELLSGVNTTAFSSKAFLQCLKQVTRELTLPSCTLSLRVACSFAVLRRVLEILAQDLVTVQKEEPGIFSPHLDSEITDVLFSFFNKSHYVVIAMKQYLMKVLRYHCELSVQNLSHLANECRKRKSLALYAAILDWNMLNEVNNPLGFNPFTTLFSSYEEVDTLLWNTINGEGENVPKLKAVIQDLRGKDQGAMASAVANLLFLSKASRKLVEKEVSMVNWLTQEGNLGDWKEGWLHAVRCLAGNDHLRLSPASTSEELQFKALGAHILLVVSSFTLTSPLQGYLRLSDSHLRDAYVLAAPNNLLASLRGPLQQKESLGEYKHACGYVYTIGNCHRANQRAKCPNCGGSIGGESHQLDPQNFEYVDSIEKGYIADHVARSDRYYTMRTLDRKSLRVLRLLVQYCFLLGLYMGRTSGMLETTLNMQDVASIIKEVSTMISEDLVVLSTLLDCNREEACQFMHVVLASMPTMSLTHQELTTHAKRSAWENAFDQLVRELSKDVRRTLATYIEAHRGRHELTEILEERRVPPFGAATAAFTRISVMPSFENFQARYMQDESRRNDFPIVERFFQHMKRLSEMKHLMGLVQFSRAVHEQLGSKITRPEAATITVGEYLRDTSAHIQASFPAFAKAWNVMRLKVTAFECTEFKQGIPEMNERTSIGFCLVEPRDQGIYLAAILDHLRTIQNGFLNEVAADPDDRSHPSLKVHMCKAEDVIGFDEQWPQRIVFDAAMTNLQFSEGQTISYDHRTIAEHLQHHLVDHKPRFDQWEPFLYKHEAFHKHMTILSDVGELVPQVPLGSESLQGIQSEIELGTVGAGRYLAILDLSLGFLRRTGGDPTEGLDSYCERWLGQEAHLLTRMHAFNKVQLQHVVSLYEGLEDSASAGIQSLVNVQYQTPLSTDLVEELRSSVEVKRPWQQQQPQPQIPKISAELFHGMLRRFMFRYLIGDQLNAQVPLSIYITDDRLIQWPEDVVDDVYDVFPPSLLVEHSHATYLYLSEMLKIGNGK